MQRRSFLQTAGAAALLGAPALVRAQTWPNGPVRIVVGFPPGGKPTTMRTGPVGHSCANTLGTPRAAAAAPAAWMKERLCMVSPLF